MNDDAGARFFDKQLSELLLRALEIASSLLAALGCRQFDVGG